MYFIIHEILWVTNYSLSLTRNFGEISYAKLQIGIKLYSREIMKNLALYLKITWEVLP